MQKMEYNSLTIACVLSDDEKSVSDSTISGSDTDETQHASTDSELTLFEHFKI